MGLIKLKPCIFKINKKVNSELLTLAANDFNNAQLLRLIFLETSNNK
jgi:hypothetical protein